MLAKTLTLPNNSSTIDPNPPPVVNFFVRGPEGFCYFVIPHQEDQTTEPHFLSKESQLSSMWTQPRGDNLGHSDLPPANLLIQEARLCDLTSGMQYISLVHLKSIHFVWSSDTHLDIPQISTTQESIAEEVRNILISFSSEPFDTQTSYDLTDGFGQLVARRGKLVVRALAQLIREQKLTDNLISEALVSIGRLQDDSTKNERFELLIGLLHHRAPIVRDGAIAGLSFMDDRKAIPYLRKALILETVHTLKGNIEIAIKDLEAS